MFTRLARSFRHRNYRLYFFGQVISLHGTWMQNVAQAWLVYRLTESSFMLGLVSFLSLIPVLLFGLWGGAIADLIPRHRLYMGAQVLALVQAVTLGILTLSGWVRVEHVLVLAFLLGLVHAVEIPARHALVGGLVPKADLPNAVGLNSSTFNLARTLGPMIAGGLIALIGEGWVFMLNALSFVAVIAALRAMRWEAIQVVEGRKRGVLDGLRFVWALQELRVAILMIGMVSLFATPYIVLMPVFAREVFGGDASLLGVLVGSAGAGALVGALHLAQRGRSDGLQGLIAMAAFLLSVSLMLFSQVTHQGLALALLALVGFSITSLVAATNTYLQVSAPDDRRGRVMSLFSVVFIGLAPVGNLASGAVAEVLGVQATVLIMGAVLLLAALVFQRFRLNRRES